MLGGTASWRISAGKYGASVMISRISAIRTGAVYAGPATASAYPPDLARTVTAAGRLDTTIWPQELKVGDLLIRDTATTHPVARRRDVQPGDIAVLATEGGWGASIPVAVRRDGGA
jgi:hypothetical protein